jgi:hypothetical protein
MVKPSKKTILQKAFLPSETVLIFHYFSAQMSLTFKFILSTKKFNKIKSKDINFPILFEVHTHKKHSKSANKFSHRSKNPAIKTCAGENVSIFSVRPDSSTKTYA